MECRPKEKTHRFPMACRRCYCGAVTVPAKPTDGSKDNEFLFRKSTILRRQKERIAEEEARLEAESIEFDADLPEVAAKGPHIPGSVRFSADEFLSRFGLDEDACEKKDRALLSDLGLRGEALDKALQS